MASEVAHVMDAISDEISLRIFKLIKESTTDKDSLKREHRIGYKQCYDRIHNLINIGLIRRKDMYYSVTSFGHVVYEAQAKVSKSMEIRSALDLLDMLRRSDIPRDECAKFVNQFIHDRELREIIANR